MRTCNFVWGTANSIGNADWRRGERGMWNMIGEWPHNSHEINKEERTSNRTEPNRAEPILSEPHRKPMPSPTWAVTHSAIVNHRVEALKNRM